MDLGVMAMEGYSMLSKAPGLEPHHQIQFNVIFWIFVGGRASEPTAEVLSAYSTAQGNWAP